MMRNVDICADCGTPDPTWASVNRGILICDDCCSIHRNLGRHVTIVKSLKRGSWPTTLLNMTRELYASGSNEIWEYTLLLDNDSKLIRRVKPKSNDTPEAKHEFIQSKHKLLAFIPRIDTTDESKAQQLSEELHSTVRTSAVKEALRLLVLGASPNWWHRTRNNMPLHIAAGCGQSSQIELLLIWGADPCCQDANGNTPVDYALASNHPEIAQRLIEASFEVTDRLTAYVTGGRKADHKAGKHLLVPEISEMLQDAGLRQLHYSAQSKLRSLNNKQIEDLCKDAFDEVDRREIDAVFSATLNSRGDGGAMHHFTPFLPVDPRFSAVRNQARQKLGRLNKREFYCLIVDILSEIKCRDTSVAVTILSSPQNSTGSTQSNSSLSCKDESQLSPAKSLDKCSSSHSASSSSLYRRSRLREIASEEISSFDGDGQDYDDVEENDSLAANRPLPKAKGAPEVQKASKEASSFDESSKKSEETCSSENNEKFFVLMRSMQQDIRDLQSKVENLLAEKNDAEKKLSQRISDPHALTDEDLTHLPSQEMFNEKTFLITKQIQALKTVVESKDCGERIEEFTQNTAQCVNDLVLEFTEVPINLPTKFKTCLLNISSCMAKLIREAKNFVERIKKRQSQESSPAKSQEKAPKDNEDKAIIMENAYQLAKNLKQLHLLYAEMISSLREEPTSPYGKTSTV